VIADTEPFGPVRPERFACVIDVGPDGRIEQVTDDIHELLGWRADSLIGRELTTIIPDRFHLPHRHAFGRFVETGILRHHGRPLALPGLRPDGSEVDLELVLSSHTSPTGRRSVVGVVRLAGDPGAPSPGERVDSDDVIERVRHRLEHLIAADRPVREVFSAAVEPVGTAFGWSVGVLWAFDPWLERLMAMHVWERTPGAHPHYIDATRRARFLIGEGFSAEMWHTRRPAWLSDLAGEPDFHRAAAAAADGLHTGIFVPIVAATGMIGILELVDERRRGVDTEVDRGLRTIADEVGRHLAERLRRETEAIQRERLQLAMSAGRMGMWTFHIPTGQVTWDRTLEEVHGIPAGSFGGTFEAFASMIHSDDRESALATIEDAVAERRSFDISYRAIGADEAIRWIQGSGAPLFDQDGEMQVMTGIGLDVTDEVLDRDLLHRRAITAALAADVGSALVSDAVIDERLDRVVGAIAEHLDLTLVRVWTLADGDDALRLVASAGMYRHLDGEHSRVPVGQWKIGRIAATRRSHVTNDVPNDEQISDPDWARSEGIRAFAGFPLMAQDRCVGVLGVFSRLELTGDVLGALASMTDSLAVAIAQNQEAQRVRMLLGEAQQQRELALSRLRERQHVASVLQASLLPPDLPDIPGLDVAAAYRSGVEDVGGDFYDLFPLGADRWGFMIGDVCGRGPEAARFTALARHTLRTALLLGRLPAKSLLALDQAIGSVDTQGRFCTAVCGVVQANGGGGSVSVRLGVAGHPPPLLRRHDGTVEEIVATGPLLGVVPSAKFVDTPVELVPGDVLLLYTDGVVEARGADGLFGHDRLVRWLAATTPTAASAITDELVGAVNEFDEMRTRDDLAILTIRCR
jgi:sigma-B regulation protein RsbU (phosphoserine phosphatase)